MMEEDSSSVLVITNTDLVPPGGWRYTQEESGFKIEDISFKNFKNKIYNHRVANGYDLDDGWWDIVQLEVCLDLGISETHCGFVDPDHDKQKPKALKVRDLLQFFRVIREWKIKKGFAKVDKEVAEQRAAICVQCPKNKAIPGCKGCAGIVRWLGEFLTEADQTIDHDKLENCEVCKCVLSLKVHLPMDVIQAAARPDQDFPSFCWMHEA